jgi:hypothetical protein
MDGDLKKGEKKKLHKKLRHPKGEHKKNHQGKARSHKHMDGVRHHMADGHSPKSLDLGNLGGDHPAKPEMSTKHNSKRSIQRREKRLTNVPL